jgi:hypothetical protein
MTNQEKQLLLDNLERALFSGHLKVKNGDKEIQYQTSSEMRTLRDSLKLELGQAPTRAKRVFASHSKGFSE